MKRVLLLLCVAIMMVTMLTGCGNIDKVLQLVGKGDNSKEIVTVDEQQEEEEIVNPLEATIAFNAFSDKQRMDIVDFMTRNFETLEKKYQEEIDGVMSAAKVYMGLADVDLDGVPEIFVGGTHENGNGLVKFNIYKMDETGKFTKFIEKRIVVTANEGKKDTSLMSALYISPKGLPYYIPTYIDASTTPNTYTAYKLYVMGEEMQQWNTSLLANGTKVDLRKEVTDTAYPYPSFLQYIDKINLDSSIKSCIEGYEKAIADFEMPK